MFNEQISFELNSSQQRAVSIKNKNIVVIAGAGCGKTKTIIAKAIYLLNSGVSPENIQILTFTRKAANEIIDRINYQFSGQEQDIYVSTFHSWCTRILHKYNQFLGIEKFQIIDKEDQLAMMKKARSQTRSSSVPLAPKLVDIYSFCRNTLKPLSEILECKYPEYSDSIISLKKIMEYYENEKRSNFYFDYDDILDVVATAMMKYSDIDEVIANEYKYILVDEMQDTNPLQWKLLERFVGKSFLFCVGDDAQSIYGFRGADFEILHSFKKRIPDAKIIKLEDNYRSTQEILNVSNWLINKSVLKYGKNLRAVRGEGSKPQLHSFYLEQDELIWLTKTIKIKHLQGKNWKDILILVRSSSQERSIEKLFISNNIPYVFIGGVSLLNASHVKDVLSVLRIINNPKDRISWMRYFCLFHGVGPKGATNEIIRIIRTKNIIDYLNGIHEHKFKLAVKIVYDAIKTGSQVYENLKSIITNLTPVLSEKYKNDNWSERKQDFDYLLTLSKEKKSINSYIEDYLLNPLYEKELNNGDNAVIISTIHSAKGMESDVCFFPMVNKGIYPSMRDVSDEDGIEECRRLMYVALTRAKDELILSRNSQFQNKKYLDELINFNIKQMYFLNNIPDDLFQEFNHTENTNITVLNGINNIEYNNKTVGTEVILDGEIIVDTESVFEEHFRNNLDIKVVKISEKVNNISYCAFQGCKNMESIHISKTVTNIASTAFLDCVNLKFIYIDENNTSYYSKDGIIYSKNGKKIITAITQLKKLVINENVEYISSNAFRQSFIENVVVKSKKLSIENHAFQNCENLVTFAFGKGQYTIGDGIFEGCGNLEEILNINYVYNIKNREFRIKKGVNKYYNKSIENKKK